MLERTCHPASVPGPASRKRPFPIFLLLALSWVGQACINDPVSVQSGGGLKVTLHVSGGIAGADYTLNLDGETGELIGESCVSVCDFSDGEILQTLTIDQVVYVRALFTEANVHGLDGEDFGVQCCDQFYFDLDFRDSSGRSRVEGSSEAFPQDLRVAVSTVLGMASGTLPVIVDFVSDPSSWPGDPYQIEAAEVSGQSLMLRVAYSGGCKVHDLKAVAWGGWIEESPIEVGLFLAHEDFDDPCDAWVTRDLYFDLGSLRLAYEESHGQGEPGATTLILVVENPLDPGPQDPRRLDYSF